MKKLYLKYKFDLLLISILCTSVILIFSTYAWFSSTLDVVIADFNMHVESKQDLLISLDGKNFGYDVEINKDSLITNLNNIYPNHTNQWSDLMDSVSTIGLTSNKNNKFNIFYKSNKRKNTYVKGKGMKIEQYDESKYNLDSPFIAFDLFFKNISPNPYTDDIYISEKSVIVNSNPNQSDNAALYSTRIGFVINDTAKLDDKLSKIQSLTCNPYCKQTIYEPYSSNHDKVSISIMRDNGITIEDGVSYPTYALYKNGDLINSWNGTFASKDNFDKEHFDYQSTLTDIKKPIMSIKEGITKVRVYFWLEGQDLDSLEKVSKNYEISVALNFKKDYGNYD